MPFPHRVMADGSFAFHGARGSLTGNRGILHDAAGNPTTARWRHQAWISCTLNQRADRAKLPLTAPGHYTPLFFLDEAVALAAGHRPCALCRRQAFTGFRSAWAAATGLSDRAPEIDRHLHAARLTPKRQPAIREADCAALPDHSIIRSESHMGRLFGDALLPLTAAGYGQPLKRPEGRVLLLTPLPLIRVLQEGYAPALTPAADRASWPDHRG
ncbi:hypothetical protein [Falsigemmobacter faecalis]|uniref:Uncharacterized protein n=1 Tax=Falsigemmobacter faecalis TaxID=2488730 RepID=A0A3P3DLM1_9RHOB|nr:hypothetical protein [Falsigemmobacter faecalis]RRH75147.1 hypothetical protein EG244_09180 [Falsigemmobacter faecalis]